MSLVSFLDLMKPAIENQMRQIFDTWLPDEQPEFRHMLSYHLGWEDENIGKEIQGKRIRPILLLLCTHLYRTDWQVGLPGAAAVELIHNFSLIHDDIQDVSLLRHNRSAVWVKWGIAQGINAGDLMFTLANQAVLQLEKTVSAEVALNAAKELQQTCISLTLGQYLDLSYETRSDLRIADYWPMVEGKTAALVACAAEMGAIIGGANPENQKLLWKFGFNLGLAFQILDDWLGIWGNSFVTGKSTESDLVSGKKSLPVLWALENSPEFRHRWENGPIKSEDAPGVAQYLKTIGSQAYTEYIADQFTQKALKALSENGGELDINKALIEFTRLLMHRQS